jgi:hypothetical protein
MGIAGDAEMRGDGLLVPREFLQTQSVEQMSQQFVRVLLIPTAKAGRTEEMRAGSEGRYRRAIWSNSSAGCRDTSSLAFFKILAIASINGVG